jgi:hypothetical protein
MAKMIEIKYNKSNYN